MFTMVILARMGFDQSQGPCLPTFIKLVHTVAVLSILAGLLRSVSGYLSHDFAAALRLRDSPELPGTLSRDRRPIGGTIAPIRECR